MRRAYSLEKTPMLVGLRAGGKGDDRGWDGWMASRTQWTWVLVNSRSWWWTGRPGVWDSWGPKSWTRLRDWTTLLCYWKCLPFLLVNIFLMYLAAPLLDAYIFTFLLGLCLIFFFFFNASSLYSVLICLCYNPRFKIYLSDIGIVTPAFLLFPLHGKLFASPHFQFLCLGLWFSCR